MQHLGYPNAIKGEMDGINKLSIKQLGLPVDKSMQCSDWSERPLVEVRKDLLMFVSVSVLFVHSFKYLFINDLFVYLFVCLSVCLSVCLIVCLSIYLSIYLLYNLHIS